MTKRIQFLDEQPDIPFRLGRHVNHDEQSKNFKARKASQIRSCKHRFYGAQLDQGRLGSCTGNALTHALGYMPVYKAGTKPKLTQPLAVGFYSRATQIDPFPGVWAPEDTGSDGLSVCKAGIEAGWITSYDWAFGLQHCLQTLTLRSVMIGSVWQDTMFRPDADGRLHIGGSYAGGHEYVAFGIDLGRKRVWCRNSWGLNWGLKGTFYLTFDDLDSLLQQQGDVIAPRRQ